MIAANDPCPRQRLPFPELAGIRRGIALEFIEREYEAGALAERTQAHVNIE